MTELDTITAYSHWASTLVNGEPYFGHPTLGGLAGEVVDYEIMSTV